MGNLLCSECAQISENYPIPSMGDKICNSGDTMRFFNERDAVLRKHCEHALFGKNAFSALFHHVAWRTKKY